MEDKLNSLLADDERVLWFGRPTKSKLLQAYDRKHQILMWAILAAFLLFSAAIVIPYMVSIQRSWEVMAIAVLIINVIPFIMALRPWMDQKLLENKCVCAVTDRRVISVVKDTVHTLPLAGIEWEISNRDGAMGSLRLGAAANSKERDDRADAVLGLLSFKDERTTFGMVFFHIDQVDTVANLLAASSERDAA